MTLNNLLLFTAAKMLTYDNSVSAVPIRSKDIVERSGHMVPLSRTYGHSVATRWGLSPNAIRITIPGTLNYCALLLFTAAKMLTYDNSVSAVAIRSNDQVERLMSKDCLYAMEESGQLIQKAP